MAASLCSLAELFSFQLTAPQFNWKLFNPKQLDAEPSPLQSFAGLLHDFAISFSIFSLYLTSLSSSSQPCLFLPLIPLIKQQEVLTQTTHLL